MTTLTTWSFPKPGYPSDYLLPSSPTFSSQQQTRTVRTQVSNRFLVEMHHFDAISEAAMVLGSFEDWSRAMSSILDVVVQLSTVWNFWAVEDGLKNYQDARSAIDQEHARMIKYICRTTFDRKTSRAIEDGTHGSCHKVRLQSHGSTLCQELQFAKCWSITTYGTPIPPSSSLLDPPAPLQSESIPSSVAPPASSKLSSLSNSLSSTRLPSPPAQQQSESSSKSLSSAQSLAANPPPVSLRPSELRSTSSPLKVSIPASVPAVESTTPPPAPKQSESRSSPCRSTRCKRYRGRIRCRRRQRVAAANSSSKASTASSTLPSDSLLDRSESSTSPSSSTSCTDTKLCLCLSNSHIQLLSKLSSCTSHRFLENFIILVPRNGLS
ncbi:hypothetical protein DL96DRAFT_1652125 [Flagelloscypha sp. PMI_526]|nr:hypothetical protein DL96DRAFT_1652125 [Flagelloscypha sp. PMI_526]